ncbi:MAG: translocation protein TolB, partial [Myxococcota bacterium]
GDYNTSPDWSPRGNNILYTRRGANNDFDIFFVAALVFGELLAVALEVNKDPSWSPNGQYIVFTSTRDGGGSRIYIMTADGKFQTLITRNGSGYSTPSWSR